MPASAVWIDDGRIGGVIERTEPDRLHVRITHTRARGAKLVADKGINLPDSRPAPAAMTDKDRTDLAFVAEHADMVALSFVNTVDDVRTLRELLRHSATDNPPSSSRSRPSAASRIFRRCCSRR